jgi:hypothetical protein
MNGLSTPRRVAGLAWPAAALVAALAAPVAAAPRIWVESAIEPAEVPVNLQATYVLRFGHAVDVRSIRLDPPRPRLAEVVPLGVPTVSERTVDGVRYRVHERRFAVMPFASGEVELGAVVSATSLMNLVEVGGRPAFELAAPPRRLAVTPAAAAGAWAPARDLRIVDEAPPPATLRVGEAWARRVRIEADGLDGSAIPALAVVPAPGWTVERGAANVESTTTGGRYTGIRRETLLLAPSTPGRQDLPGGTVNWWRYPGGERTATPLPALAMEVGGALPEGRPGPAGPAGTVGADRMPATAGVGTPFAWTWGLVLVALLATGLAFRRPLSVRIDASRIDLRSRRDFTEACRRGDAEAARRQLLAIAARKGGPFRSVGALAAAAGDMPELAAALRNLDAACYGRPGPAWQGADLARSVLRLDARSWRRLAMGARTPPGAASRTIASPAPLADNPRSFPRPALDGGRT